MGEIAEMMLDGTLCEGCGVHLGGSANGFPRRCRDCKTESRAMQQHPNAIYKPSTPKVICPTCKRRVKEAGLKDHMRDAHGVRS
jgi:Zn finger protein HypA/HybF involved in hydrogenase expression